MRLLISGGAGFIGSNLIRYWLQRHPEDLLVAVDKLVYGRANVEDLEGHPRFRLVVGDVSDRELVEALFTEYRFEGVIHAAAQSHVDLSIADPLETAHANVLGTLVLLEAMRRFAPQGRFHHVGTDEVFGSLGDQAAFDENSPYRPNNPYAASKAAGDHFARAYWRTYGLHTTITHCSNNYGPYQYPDKFLPKMILNGIAGRPLPIYGDGSNVRDWLFVEDHCRAIDLVFHRGAPGARYCVGGHSEWSNLQLVHHLCKRLDEKLQRPPGTTAQLVTFVPDRPGHDYRYALRTDRIERDLGWRPQVPFPEGLERTLDWYLSHLDWAKRVRLPDAGAASSSSPELRVEAASDPARRREDAPELKNGHS
ncbi:MAG: dTDP-glucose 4,6-dehydratase [Candidatus Poribacteria bacterium]|nr:MAG: dTDP-glucose 4,6-dehydratase [Candidatus Poribacteria bacterium]